MAILNQNDKNNQHTIFVIICFIALGLIVNKKFIQKENLYETKTIVITPLIYPYFNGVSGGNLEIKT
jgi:hypothetical protein